MSELGCLSLGFKKKLTKKNKEQRTRTLVLTLPNNPNIQTLTTRPDSGIISIHLEIRMAEDVKKEVISAVAAAQGNLTHAHKLAVQSNALAADIPCIQELNKITTQLTGVMQAISKLRGL